jgi:hypothetical protein
MTLNKLPFETLEVNLDTLEPDIEKWFEEITSSNPEADYSQILGAYREAFPDEDESPLADLAMKAGLAKFDVETWKKEFEKEFEKKYGKVKAQTTPEGVKQYLEPSLKLLKRVQHVGGVLPGAPELDYDRLLGKLVKQKAEQPELFMPPPPEASPLEKLAYWQINTEDELKKLWMANQEKFVTPVGALTFEQMLKDLSEAKLIDLTDFYVQAARDIGIEGSIAPLSGKPEAFINDVMRAAVAEMERKRMEAEHEAAVKAPPKTMEVGGIEVPMPAELTEGIPEPYRVKPTEYPVEKFEAPYKLTEEQHDILQGRVRVTEWNAEAAMWAGVPMDVIEKCIAMGGVNIKVAGYSPDEGGLREFYKAVAEQFRNNQQLMDKGITVEQISKLFKQEYENRERLGMTTTTGWGKGMWPESEEKEENGIRYRLSLDGQYKVPVLPTSMEEVIKAAPALIEPLKEVIGQPKLPEGYAYGNLANTLITPEGNAVMAQNDDEFEQWLQELGALPKLKFEYPTFTHDKFTSFSECFEYEKQGNMEAVNKGLAEFAEKGIITPEQLGAFFSGAITLQELNDATGGMYRFPWGEINLLPPENLEELVAEAEKNPNDFYELLQKEGRTLDTEALLEWMGATKEQIDAIYPNQPKQPKTQQELTENFTAINIEELGEKLKVLDAAGEKAEVAHVLREAGVPLESVKAYLSGKVTAQEAALTDPDLNKMMGFWERGADIDRWWASILFATFLVRQERGESVVKSILGMVSEANPVTSLMNLISIWPELNIQNPLVMRARYDAWEAPKFVKGMAELLNPLYWIPIGGVAAKALRSFGWAAKGMKAARLAEVAIKAAEKVPALEAKASKILMLPVTYPLKKIGKGIEAGLVKVGALKKGVALPDLRLEKIEDFLKYIGQKYPGRIKGNAMARQVKEASLVHNRGLEAGDAAVEMVRNQMNEVGDIYKMLGLDEAGEWASAQKVWPLKDAPEWIQKEFAEKGALGAGTIMENWKYLHFADDKAIKWIEEAHLRLKYVVSMAEELGIKIDKRIYSGLSEYFPRRVTGVKGLTKAQVKVSRAGGRVSRLMAKTSVEKRRLVDIFEEGLEKYDYASPLDTLLATVNGLYRRMAGVQATEHLRMFMKPKAAETELGKYAAWLRASTQEKLTQGKRLVEVIQRVKRGERPPGATMAAIRKDMPELAEALERVISLDRNEVTKVINGISQEMWDNLKITKQQFKDMLLDVRAGNAITKDAPLKFDEINKAIEQLTKDRKLSGKMLKEIYLNADKFRGAEKKQLLDNLLSEAGDVLGIRKGEAFVAKGGAENIMEYLRHTKLTESFSPETMSTFQNTTIHGVEYTGKEIENEVAKRSNVEADKWLKGFSSVSRAFVMTEAALDFSAPFIQGFLTLGNDLKNLIKWGLTGGKTKPTWIWPRTLGAHIASMAHPNIHRAFVAKHAETYSRYGALGLITGQGGTEFVEIMPKIAQWVKKVPLIEKPLSWLVENTFGRAAYGFSVWGEQARILGVESMERAWTKAGRNPRELVDMWNKITGVVSTRMMGVSANQRAAESAFLFAPRFVRSQFLILGDLFSRGATANEIRQIFGSSLMAWTLVYVSLCHALGQKPKLNPLPASADPSIGKFYKNYEGGDGADFFSLNIGGRILSFRTSYMSFLRLGATLAGTIATEPEKLIRLDLGENPLLRFPFQKASPTINLAKEMITGRDFLGRKFEDADDWIQDIAEKITPLVAQGIWFQDKPANPGSAAGEFFGFNTYPQSEWKTFNEMADLVVYEMPDDFFEDWQLEERENFDLHWADLDGHQEWVILQEHPELKQQLEKARTESNRYSSDAWRWFNEESKRIDNEHIETDKIQLDILRDPDSNYGMGDLRWAWSDNSRDTWVKRGELKKDKLYKTVDADLERSKKEKQESGEVTLFEQAYWEWWDYTMNDEGISDRLTNEEKYQVRQQRVDEFRKKYGETTYKAVLDLMHDGLSGQDPLRYKLVLDKLRLTDTYWKLVDESGDRDIKAREKFRQDPENVELEAMLVFWGYTSKFENPEAEALVREWMQKYDVAEKAIPAFKENIVPDEAVQKYRVTQKMWDEYRAIEKQYERADEQQYYKWRYKLEHPEINAYFNLEEGQEDARLKSLKLLESKGFLKIHSEQYSKLPLGNARYSFRAQHCDFDAEGVTYGYWKTHPECWLKGMPAPKKPKLPFEK